MTCGGEGEAGKEDRGRHTPPQRSARRHEGEQKAQGGSSRARTPLRVIVSPGGITQNVEFQ